MRNKLTFRWISLAATHLLGSVALAAGPTTAPAAGRSGPPENLIQVSWGDQILVAHGNTALDTREKVESAVDEWKEYNQATTILWRGSSYELDRYYKTFGTDSSEYRGKVARITSQFDPLIVARDRAHANGQKLLIYLTFQDHGAPHDVLYGGKNPFPWQDKLVIEHPEYQTVDLHGNYHWGVLDLANPDARRAVIDRLVTMVRDFGVDGLYLCSRTHSPPALNADQFGFNPSIVSEMKRRFNVDITKDPRFDYQSPQFAPDDAVVESWRKVQGDSWTQFYRELRTALPGKMLYAGIPRGRYFGPPYGNVYLDWEAMVREHLVDGLVLRVNSGKDLYTPLYVPHRKIGYRSSEDDDINIPTMEQCANDVYGPLAAAAGIKLFYNTTFYAPRQLARFDALPAFNGVMIWSPAREPNRGRIKHDDAFCAPGGRMTVSMNLWVNDPRPRGFQRVVSKNDIDADATRAWEIIILGDGKLQFKVNQIDPSTHKRVETNADTAEALPTKRWVNVTCSFDRIKGRLCVYVDGQLAAEHALPDLPMVINPEQDVCVGFNGGWIWHYFDGQIDNLRLANTSEPPPTRPSTTADGTFALYRFDKVDANGQISNAANAERFPMTLVKPVNTPLTPGPDGNVLDLRLKPQE